ncbi:MAG: methyltransferase domain-containing protein [Vicinamibacterales bacterium]
MSNSGIDALTSPTLKHLREHWWNDEFTGFLKETLRPRPGNRILDVGCGTGIGEVSIARLQLSQIRLYGVDLVVDNVIAAQVKARSHNIRAGFAVADACRLPFVSDSFDSTYCVAVLQHIRDVSAAVQEFARVTRPTGRIVAVEPDNAARYWHSSAPAGMRAFEAATRFFAALARLSDSGGDPSVGPKLPTLFVQHGIEPESVRLFPVSQATLGAPEAAVWKDRRARVQRLMDTAPDGARAEGRAYLDALVAYEAEAAKAGPRFVEIQNTMLFATVGQKSG